MIALDALSAYWIASHTTEERELNVTLTSQGRSGFKSHVLQLNNHQFRGLEEDLQVNLALPWVFMTPGPAVARPNPPSTPAEESQTRLPDFLAESYWLCDLEKVIYL